MWLHHVPLVLVSFSVMTSSLCDPTDWSPTGSFIHGILQTRILEWVASPFSIWEALKRQNVFAPVPGNWEFIKYMHETQGCPLWVCKTRAQSPALGKWDVLPLGSGSASTLSYKWRSEWRRVKISSAFPDKPDGHMQGGQCGIRSWGKMVRCEWWWWRNDGLKPEKICG